MADPTMKTVTIGSLTFQTGHKIREGRAIHGSGSVCKTYDNAEPSKSMCRGCRDDFYNHQNKENGGCWAFESAKVVDKIGHSSRHVMYGPDVKMTRTLSCWHAVI